MGYAPHHRLSGGASPQGEAAKQLTIFSRQGEALKRLSLLLEQKNRTRYAPHQSTTLTASPRGEALKKTDNFQQTRGSLENKERNLNTEKNETT